MFTISNNKSEKKSFNSIEQVVSFAISKGGTNFFHPGTIINQMKSESGYKVPRSTEILKVISTDGTTNPPPPLNIKNQFSYWQLKRSWEGKPF